MLSLVAVAIAAVALIMAAWARQPDTASPAQASAGPVVANGVTKTVDVSLSRARAYATFGDPLAEDPGCPHVPTA
jgi:hypothetical protein